MSSFAAWNIRGLNRPLKQKEVRQVIVDNHLHICAILESHVDTSKLVNVCKSVFKSWQWISNGNVCDKGTRIILGWDVDVVDILLVSFSAQLMNIQIMFKADSKALFASFVYANNSCIRRRELWSEIR